MATLTKKAAIIGAGLVGRSWAMLFAGAGYQVSLYDTNQVQLENAIKHIDNQLKDLKAKDLLRSNIPCSKQKEAISVTKDLVECMKDAAHVQECVWETVDAKISMFKELDTHAQLGQVLASSTSAIPAREFTANLIHKHQCVTAHPINPPLHCPLVEVVPTPWTAWDVVDRCMNTMSEIGQVPVRLKKEIIGFVLNRLQFAVLAECWNLIADDVVDVEALDKIMSEGLGCRYAFFGPMEVTHLNANGIAEYVQKYNEIYLKVNNSMKPSPSMKTAELFEKVRRQLEAKVPLNQLEERRKYRDIRLAALAKLKRDLEKPD